MSYCTIADIKNDFKKIDFSSDGAIVSEAMVTEWISQESETINSKICNRYTVPVVSGDSPASYLILKKICIFLVSERVKNKIEVKTPIASKDSEEKGPRMRSPYADLKEISEGKMHLRDATPKGTVTTSFNVDQGLCPEFDVNKQQW